MNYKNIGIALVVVILAIASVASFIGLNNQKELAAEREAQNAELQASLQELAEQQQKTAEQLADTTQRAVTKIEALESKNTELAAQLETLQAEKEALEQETSTETETPTPVTPQGEQVDDLLLGEPVEFVIDEKDVTKLFDGVVRFEGRDYDVREEFRTTAQDVVLTTSLFDDEEFGANPVVVINNRGALEYRFIFDETVSVADISAEDPLTINFLGQRMDLVSVDADEVVFRTGREVFLYENEEVTVDGKTIKLLIVDDDTAFVSVDGVTDTIREGRSETINGLDVTLETALGRDTRLGAATLVVGSDTLYTQDDGDDYFDDESFVFHVTVNGGELEELRVVYDEKHTRVDGAFPALGVGDELCFPNSFICVQFLEVVNNDYVTVELTMDEFDEQLVNDVDVNAFCAVLKADEEAFEIGTVETDEVYLCAGNRAFYQDDNDWFEVTFGDVELVNDDAVYTFEHGTDKVRIVEPSGKKLVVKTTFASEQLGAEKDEAENTELVFDGTNIGEREYDVLTGFGTVIFNPEANGDRDEVQFAVPSDRLEATILVY